ncbi:glycosyl transferase family 1 [Paracidovorax avenae]|uniref:glycosyltransferase n=1 Tax=Paracidovorax avenae TaxID=80867 RepID=UPI000D15D751|nr:glycosyltransferase [Paracidovorax avenae]AVS87485.1 glycosyl transferase family 1 [Paracidovorax avenae]AVT12028.1 glycosyl transferase family 1 [Paracidovorax avenae]
MRILIDIQACQAENKDRGIGRYAFSLVEEMCANSRGHEIFILLNGGLKSSIMSIRSSLGKYIPPRNFKVWYPATGCAFANEHGTWNRQSSELLREACIANVKPDVVLISSLFEGLICDAATSIGQFASDLPTAVILYDLIPLIYNKPYLDNPMVKDWYEEKIKFLKRAGLHLAISDSSRQESIDYLQYAPEAVVNISAAVGPQFGVVSIDDHVEDRIRHRYGLLKPYVMYTGGIDHRKNIEGLIRAFSQLPGEINEKYQIAIVCSVQDVDRQRLLNLAKEHGLHEKQLVLTGFVPEEDLPLLYNLCKVFVFPSLHEGFGLPALEAMACGKAVIGSNCSSLPEVIGDPRALFNPHDDQSIVQKLLQVLTDDEFRQTLETNAIRQAEKFSWSKSASMAWDALESYSRASREEQKNTEPVKRRRLAYVSPLPPERSGISDYSAELLPELARYYDVDIVTDQAEVTNEWVNDNCTRRSIDWFCGNYQNYDRVIYHFGNSHFHQHMFALLEAYPGVVVLHDFFLSGIVAHMECSGFEPGMWVRYLYESHGYLAVEKRIHAKDTADVVWEYPCSFPVLQNSLGVIVHSKNSVKLAENWYGAPDHRKWALIPHLRTFAGGDDHERRNARAELGIDHDDLVVCSFGLLGKTKLNHRLLDAWLGSDLCRDQKCVLIFVGENERGAYGKQLLSRISGTAYKSRIKITGWASEEQFRTYLKAADIGVQLRTLSRGETSGTVLDCMNYGLATIVNANGSMADLPDEGVYKLPDQFSDSELIAALQLLYSNPARREELGKNAQEIIFEHHSPRKCAEDYCSAIENFYGTGMPVLPALVDKITSLKTEAADFAQVGALSRQIDKSIELGARQNQILVDISELIQRDARSGIQRVVRSILKEWLSSPPQGYRIEPVYACASKIGYRYARNFTLDFVGCPGNYLMDEPITYGVGDYFIGLDLQPAIVSAQREAYQSMRQAGTLVKFVVYDLLLIKFPQYFLNGGSQQFEQWLEVVSESDGAVCISKSVAHDLQGYLKRKSPKQISKFKIDWFHLGADLQCSLPTRGIPDDADWVLSALHSQCSFLMVGTLEPRKGHEQVLAAFDILWGRGHSFNLVIVGKNGWMVDALIEKMKRHKKYGKHLFLIKNASDEYLERIYENSRCLLAASYDEGFGLPLIEAAKHNLPVLARDIPVFREVAGDAASYFSADDAVQMSDAILDWARRWEVGDVAESGNMQWLTWRQSADNLFEAMLEERTSFGVLHG